MDSINIVLAAVDCSEASYAALVQADRIAAWRQSRLHVVHVVDDQVIRDLAVWWQTSVAEARDRCLDSARHHVEGFAAEAIPRTPVELHLLAGSPIDQIRSLVVSLGADLIVGGVNGQFVEPGAGMLATRLVRKLPSKVMLVRPEATTIFRSVLACIDFSESAREVVEQARRLSSKEPARIHFFHAYRRPWEALPGMENSGASAADAQELEDRLRSHMSVFTSADSFPDARIHVVAANGHPGVISGFAKEHDIDLILVGSKGQTDLDYVTVGSTAERLIRDLPCSLLVVKQRDERRARAARIPDDSDCGHSFEEASGI